MAIVFERTLTEQKRVKIPEWYWKLYGFKPGDEVIIEVKRKDGTPQGKKTNNDIRRGKPS